MDQQHFEEDEFVEQKIINEEYKVWKKNAVYLYDMMLSTALEWPTLTTQWFPDKQAVPDKDYSTHRLLIGTHTSGDAKNYLEIAEVQLPNPVAMDTPDQYDESRGEMGGYGAANKKTGQGIDIKFNIIQKIDHPGEVNKARYQPQNPNMIATMCTDGRVLVFDRTKHRSIPHPQNKVNPQLELIGHEKEGYGLSWDPHNQGQLATGSEDKTVKVWDLNKFNGSNRALQATMTFTHHSSIVNDVQYHPLKPGWIGTASDDLSWAVIDARRGNNSKPIISRQNAHKDAINAISFNPLVETLIATGSADKTICLWDLRNPDIPSHTLEGHQDIVTSLQWNPLEPAILGSASYDRRVLCWDLSLIGIEQSPEDSEDGPPEL